MGEQRRLAIQVKTTTPIFFPPGPGDTKDSEGPELAVGGFLAGGGISHTSKVRGFVG